MRIRPFRGYRYAAGQAADLTKVVAPPYDQIDPELQEHLHALHPHNVVRITLPRDEPEGDRYRQARQVLDAWLREGVWAPDPEPALYPYEQTYRFAGATVTRAGFIALGEVTEYSEKIVRPHERTHAGPKRDRMRLLEATASDVGLLFMLVSDSGGALRVAGVPVGEPVACARDLRGELHRLWCVTDPAAIARVTELMAPKPVIIADGHHRYETAVEYARAHPRARWKLMNFCILEAPGLSILPNHRLVHGIDPAALQRLGEAARPWFEVTPIGDPLGFRPEPRCLGVVTREGAAAFRLRDEAFERIAWPPERSAAWRRLAVSILHEGVLKPLLDITDARLDAGTHVDYTPDQEEAVRRVRAGRDQAAFLIAPTTPEELQRVVEGGELLPHKSTHFYPKLLDGLVFHRLEEA